MVTRFILVALIAFWVSLSACVSSVVRFPEDDAVSVCLAGVGPIDEGANAHFAYICMDYALGLVAKCSGEQCQALWGVFDTDQALDALIQALDSDADGDVDDDDRVRQVNLLGYSWGGMNAVELAEKFARDRRVVATQRRRIDRLILVDPYKWPNNGLTLPDTAKRTWVFRHSIAPATDCSYTYVMGPYLGLEPNCVDTVNCQDVDFSLDPDTVVVTLDGDDEGDEVELRGKDIDHCNVLLAAMMRIGGALGN